MSENLKIAGVVTAGFACAILAVAYGVVGGDFLKDLCIAFGGVFGMFFGLPAFAKGVSKLVK